MPWEFRGEGALENYCLEGNIPPLQKAFYTPSVALGSPTVMRPLCCYKRQWFHLLASLNQCAQKCSKNKKNMEKDKNQCVRPGFPETSVRLLEKLYTLTSCCRLKQWERGPGQSPYEMKWVTNPLASSPYPNASPHLSLVISRWHLMICVCRWESPGLEAKPGISGPGFPWPGQSWPSSLLSNLLAHRGSLGNFLSFSINQQILSGQLQSVQSCTLGKLHRLKKEVHWAAKETINKMEKATYRMWEICKSRIWQGVKIQNL